MCVSNMPSITLLRGNEFLVWVYMTMKHKIISGSIRLKLTKYVSLIINIS